MSRVALLYIFTIREYCGHHGEMGDSLAYRPSIPVAITLSSSRMKVPFLANSGV